MRAACSSAWLWSAVFLLLGVVGRGDAPAPQRVQALVGDRLVLLHWDSYDRTGIGGWRVSRSDRADGEFHPLVGGWVQRGGFADTTVTNGGTYTYRVEAVGPNGRVGKPSKSVMTRPQEFADDSAFLELQQRAAFEFFRREANPANGLVRDRNTTNSKCSIAAVGFGLSGWVIAVDRGWVPRAEARERVRTTLTTFAHGRQGAEAAGIIGNRGWFYHFLEMNNAERAWRCELSSIDTALLLAGVVDAREFFDGADPGEQEIRLLAKHLLSRVDWRWMMDGQASLSMGWKPEDGYVRKHWVGYNEGMILYLLGLGVTAEHGVEPARALPAESWAAWTAGYAWRTNFGRAYVEFGPLFGHQYSHAWVDFRGLADAWMRARRIDYFENSRRATLVQQAYAEHNPNRFQGYGKLQWGFTACDGPGGYAARGALPVENDDGTLAPTAVGGSMPFAPEICLPTLREFHQRYREQIWTAYGFRDAFNPTRQWWGPDVLGIDLGIMLVMIENHRTGRPWQRCLRAPELRRGLERAGFAKANWPTGRTSP